MDKNFDVKEKLELEGRVEIFEGIPRDIYSLQELDRLQFLNPDVDVEEYVVPKKILVSEGNRIVNSGKENLLNHAFEGNGDFLDFMAIGDGGYDFAVEKKLFPSVVDSSLGHILGSANEINAFDPTTGDAILGFTKSMSSTFFSETKNTTDFKSENRVDFFVNEMGILTSGGSLFSRVTFNNIPFRPSDLIALTITWYIKIS